MYKLIKDEEKERYYRYQEVRNIDRGDLEKFKQLVDKQVYECIGCRRSIKFSLKNLKRIAIWEE